MNVYPMSSSHSILQIYHQYNVFFLDIDSDLSVGIDTRDGDICVTCMFTTSNTVGCIVIMYSALIHGQIIVHSISMETLSCL